MRIAVAGAGAIGGFIAAMLRRAGADVSLTARGKHLEAIASGGLDVRSADAGAFSVQLPAAQTLDELGVFDVVLVTVKAHQLPALREQLAKQVQGGCTIVPMQNGVPFWYFENEHLETVDPGGALRETLPQTAIIGSVVHVSGNIASPGTVEQSGGTRYIFGSVEGAEHPRLHALVSLFGDAGMAAEAAGDIRADVWRKMLGNVSLNPISALTRLSIRPMIENDELRALIASVMEEVSAVARATGIDVGIDPEDRIRYAARLSDVKTSMLQDLEAGRPLELEPIVGAVVEIAGIRDVRTPLTRAIYALTKGLSSN